MAVQRSGSEELLWLARFRIELGQIYLYQGRSDDAIKLLLQAPPPSLENDEMVRRELLLAIAQNRLGKPELARQAFISAEALHPENVMQAEMLGAQGSVLLDQSRPADAESFFQGALYKAQQLDAAFLEMQMWMNLGVVALQLEHYEDALNRFNRGSALAQSVGAVVAQEKAIGNIGWTYYRTGDYARALDNSMRAKAQASEIGATLDETQWLTNAGMSQFMLNDIDSARSSYEQSLTLAEKLQASEKILNAHVALGYLLVHQQPLAAEMHIRKALELARMREDRNDELEPLYLQTLLFIEEGHTQSAETCLLLLDSESRSSPWLQWEVEKTLATLYVNTSRKQDADHWFQRAIETFHRQRLSLNSVELELPFLENGSDLYLGYMEHLIHTGRGEQALQVLDQSRAETLAEGLGVPSGPTSARATSARAVAARLHGTIFVYCLRPGASYLWASNGAKQQMYVLPGSETLLPLIARHTEAILASKDLLAQSDSPGRTLYDGLLKPAESFLQPGSRVFIIGDKELSGLNFETLISARDRPHYWIEDATVINARSLRMLTASIDRTAPRAKQEMLLIGDPIYHAPEYAALPNAAAEMTRVASHFPGDHSSIFSGVHASPLLYTRVQPGHFSYIHFVAHATANETNPLDSAIILSDEAGATRLYARDILKQPLNADLVTLSSCYGSGIRNYSGEGVVGLVWAFLRAGAHSVIGAMWEVSDVSTPELMDNMYTQLLAGSKPDAALRSAKLDMLHSGGVFRKPLYWASFQLYSGR